MGFLSFLHFSTKVCRNVTFRHFRAEMKRLSIFVFFWCCSSFLCLFTISLCAFRFESCSCGPGQAATAHRQKTTQETKSTLRTRTESILQPKRSKTQNSPRENNKHRPTKVRTRGCGGRTRVFAWTPPIKRRAYQLQRVTGRKTCMTTGENY